MLTLVAAAVGLQAALVVLTIWLGRRQSTKQLVPVAAATALGFLVAVAAYFFVFAVGQNCSGRGDFACQMNENQGVLTTLGLILAIGALWTTILIRFFDQRAHARSLDRRVEAAVLAALEEVKHNLIHVALSYDHSGKFVELPLVKLDETSKLLHEPIRSEVNSAALNAAELIQRNCAALARVGEEGGQTEEPEPHPICGFTMHSLKFLMAASAYNEKTRLFLHEPGLQDLHELVLATKSIYFAFRTSDDRLKAELPTLRNTETKILCWFDDEHPDRATVLPQGPRFDDLAEGHAH